MNILSDGNETFLYTYIYIHSLKIHSQKFYPNCVLEMEKVIRQFLVSFNYPSITILHTSVLLP